MKDKKRETTTGATPQYVFVHLLMIIMLYVSVIATLVLYFQYINHLYFDSLLDDQTSILDGIRWGSSVLLVSFPVLVYSSYTMYKMIVAEPEQRNKKVRRWLMYFTQFLTAVTIIVDLMVLIYNFYGGELTARFALKVVTVLLVSAVVLFYYRWELRWKGEKSQLPRRVAVIVGVALLGSIVAGFVIAGTPAQQRDVRMDDQRVEDLQEIQMVVVQYAQSYAALPADTAALEEFDVTSPVDPDTDAAYTYSRVDDTEFMLCAVFENDVKIDSEARDRYVSVGPYPEGVQIVGTTDWSHPAGEHCVNSTVNFPETQ